MQLLRKYYMADPPGGSAGPSKEDLEAARALREEYAQMRLDLTGIGQQLSEQLKDTLRLDALKGKQAAFDRVDRKTALESIKNLRLQFSAAAKGLDKTIEAQQNLNKAFESSKKVQERISKIKNNQASIEQTILELEIQGLGLSKEQQIGFDRSMKSLEKQLDIENQLLDKAQAREKAIGRLGKLFEGLTKIPILGGLIDAEDVLKAINKEAEKSGSRWKSFGAGIGATFKSIGTSLTDPFVVIPGILSGIIAAIKLIVDLGVSFDKKTFEIAKNLGISVKEATALQAQFVSIANSSENFGLTSMQIAKTYTEISDTLGFMAPLQDGFAETAALLQKRLGLSAESMSALATQSVVAGTSLEKTYETVEATRVVEGARNNLLLTNKQLIDGIAKTSAAVVINFKGSVGALSEAVIRATKLGTTLDQINKQGESLIDFESSISKEFEAQLLTGRNINLTKAREYALMGDTKGLMEELNKQQVTYDGFMSENIIARKAEAEMVGLSVEEMSKQLLMQKQANKLGAEQGQSAVNRYNQLVSEGKTREEIVGILDKSAEQDLYRASMADKFESAVERIKDTLGKIVAGPMGQLVDQLTDFLSKSENVAKISNFIKDVFKGIASVIQKLPQMLSAAITVAKVLASLTIARAVAGVVAASSSGGIPGLIAGGIAAVGTYAWLSSLMDGAGSGGPPSISTDTGNNSSAAPLWGTPESMEPSKKQTETANTSMTTPPIWGMQPRYDQPTTTTTQTTTPAPVFNVKVDTYVGTENWSKTTRTAIQEDHGSTLK